jgi:hypothetical protein
MLDISPVLDFISRTGERCVFFNPQDGKFFAIQSLAAEANLKKGQPIPGMGFSKSAASQPFVEPWERNSFAPEPPVE